MSTRLANSRSLRAVGLRVRDAALARPRTAARSIPLLEGDIKSCFLEQTIGTDGVARARTGSVNKEKGSDVR